MLASAGKTKVGLLLIIFALVVVVLGLTWVAVSWDNSQSATTSLPTNTVNQTTLTPTVTVALDQLARQVQRTTLTDPSGQDVLGEVVREAISEDDYRLVVAVKLPDPAEGDFYAVWLIQTEGSEKQSLGRLNKSAVDYTLEYQSSAAKPEFDKIIVTSGPRADEQVGTIVAEGVMANQLVL